MVFTLAMFQDELEYIRAELYAVYGAYMESGEAYLREGRVATPPSLMLWYWSERGYVYGKGIYSSSCSLLELMQYAVAVALITPGTTSTRYNVLTYDAFYYPPMLSVKSWTEESGAYLHLYRFIEVEYVAKTMAAIMGKVDWTRKDETWGFIQPTSMVV
jgi:hypothetical protein